MRALACAGDEPMTSRALAPQPRPATTVVNRPVVLVIDDDPTLAEVVGRYLIREGYEVVHALDGETGLARAVASPPELILLDLMLPGIDGLEVCSRLRESPAAAVPVIMLTARAAESDRVTGLDAGADDYLAKPFSLHEMGARVRAVLRRVPPRTADTLLRAGDLEVDPVARTARRGDDVVALPAKEFDLLAHLMSRPGEALARDQLLEAVWGWTCGDTATVTVHVRRLRQKIEADPSRPRHLRTVWGLGYRFDP